MYNLIKTISIFVFFYSLTVVAETAPTALDLVDRDIKSSVAILNHETLFYTYLSFKSDNSSLQKTMQSEENRKTTANMHVLNSSSQFRNMLNHRTAMANAGLGLYLATDPFISSPGAEEYSGANFGDTMIELTFSKDTKYLSLKKAIPLKDDTISALLNENILKSSQLKSLLQDNLLSQDTLKYMAESQYILFRILFEKLVTNNNIVLIEYEWLTSLEMFCDNKHLTSAMVYIGSALPDTNLLSTILIYWPGKIKLMNLDPEENFAYLRNAKLIKVLAKLKPLEKKSRYTKAISYINDFYQDQIELQDVRAKLFKCTE
jgi:hypothetical protein